MSVKNGTTKTVVETTIPLRLDYRWTWTAVRITIPFDFNSTALRPFDDLRNDRVGVTYEYWFQFLQIIED